MGKEKRVNKNKKRNWRKHVDITEIEEHLEDQRLQERTGGLVAQKTNDQLFFLDKTSSAKQDAVSVASVSKRVERSARPLKCHSALLPDPSIKPARIPHNVKKSTLKRLCASRKQRVEAGLLTATERQAEEHRRSAVKQSSTKRRTKNHVNIAKYDLWAGDGVGEDVDAHYMRVTRKQPINVPKHRAVKPSGLPAVQVPHPGASYNPTLQDYQSLLQEAHEIEVLKEKKEMAVIRATDEKFPDRKEAPTQETYLKEMSAGLFEEPVEEAVSDNEQSLSLNPPVRREDKKTITQRNKEKRQKLAALKAQKQKEERIKKSNMQQIRSQKREVAALERSYKERAAHRAQVKERFRNKPKKLGRVAYEPPDTELKLTEELQGSLRLLQPEGHLLEDRFKSLQRRNIIEPRKRAKRLRKYKLKEFEKKTHKAITE